MVSKVNWYVIMSVFGLRTNFESCSDVCLADFEHVDACLYFMVKLLKVCQYTGDT